MEEHVSSFLASKYDATQMLESRICEPEIAVSSVKSSGSGQIKLKEAALKTSANSFLEKEKDLQDKIEELERRLEELSQNSASFYEYQFQKQWEKAELSVNHLNKTSIAEIESTVKAKICASHGVYEEFVSRSSSINAEYEAKAHDTQVDQHTSTTPKLKIIAISFLASIEEMRTLHWRSYGEFYGPNLGHLESKIQQHQQGLCLGASPNNRTLFAHVNLLMSSLIRIFRQMENLSSFIYCILLDES
ncbi:hypothetical protein LOK49_LG14G01268 [Camellia lanceoleosa]|uniref:Uncharacterized protein n=1 Tax=Camellia lanceoleosa TaxID=1840588 RepID=A0ACC0FCF0_9ERIC|nr:hypothetical protein LOK49_LG14G01268 [Camellia lanceoleosa]